MPQFTAPNNRTFAEPSPGPDPTAFAEANLSSTYYTSKYYAAHKNLVSPIPTPSTLTPMDFADVVGDSFLSHYIAGNKITFHTVGDTGAAKGSSATGQVSSAAIINEQSVADAMSQDVASFGPDTPAFFFHLGDVVYNFGEPKYYFDQFYDPFRAYDRPIFAIPGNHDGMQFGPTASAPTNGYLDGFLRNFCATTQGPSPDAVSLNRWAMNQPGVYFSLNAPFVTIIGLYSNVLDGPGVICSQDGKFTTVTDDQLTYLSNVLKSLKPAAGAKRDRAIVLAVHHPPVSVDSKHITLEFLPKYLADAFTEAGVYPDAILCGHAHLYQRFTWALEGAPKPIPVVVAGCGGFSNVMPMTGTGTQGMVTGAFTLEVQPMVDFGYCIVTVDMRTAPGQLTITYNSTASTAPLTDTVTVTLD